MQVFNLSWINFLGKMINPMEENRVPLRRLKTGFVPRKLQMRVQNDWAQLASWESGRCRAHF